MPYIKQDQREALKVIQPANAAQLCYMFSLYLKTEPRTGPIGYRNLIDSYIAGYPKEEVSWKVYAEVLAGAMGALLEVRRRSLPLDDSSDVLADAVGQWYVEVVGPYEDAKLAENGDVF
jgi:hypothetical protein